MIGIANINSTTGIAYGYISAQALDQEVVQILMYGRYAINHSEKTFEAEYRAEHGLSEDDELPHDAFDSYEGGEEEVSGKYEGVSYMSSYLGGALHFFIFNSPHTTAKARMASPCVPNAGILDTLDGNVTSYDVPPDWRQ